MLRLTVGPCFDSVEDGGLSGLGLGRVVGEERMNVLEGDRVMDRALGHGGERDGGKRVFVNRGERRVVVE